MKATLGLFVSTVVDREEEPRSPKVDLANRELSRGEVRRYKPVATNPLRPIRYDQSVATWQSGAP
jgi:hypothetical protein